MKMDKLLLASKDEDVKELLPAEMSREDRIKEAPEEDELSDGSLSKDEELDEEADEAIVGIFNSRTDPATSTLSIIRLVMFLSRSNDKNGSFKHQVVLEVNFRAELKAMEEAGASEQDVRECIKATIGRTSSSFHPIKLQGTNSLTPEMFVSFLLSQSDTKAGKHKKA
jgi:hypothetical protein